MTRFITILLISFVAAILQLSLLPNFSLFGGMVILPVAIICYQLVYGSGKRKNLDALTLAFATGLFLDLLSSGNFMSATISLFGSCLLLLGIEKILPLENELIVSNVLVISGVLIYDFVYMILNRALIFEPRLWSVVISDIVLTLIFFWIASLIIGRFNREYRLPEIRLH